MQQEDNPNVPDCPEVPVPDDSDFRDYADDDPPDERDVFLPWGTQVLLEVSAPWISQGYVFDPFAMPVRRSHYCRRCQRRIVTLEVRSHGRMTFNASELFAAGSGRWGADLFSRHVCEAQ